MCVSCLLSLNIRRLRSGVLNVPSKPVEITFCQHLMITKLCRSCGSVPAVDWGATNNVRHIILQQQTGTPPPPTPPPRADPKLRLSLSSHLKFGTATSGFGEVNGIVDGGLDCHDCRWRFRLPFVEQSLLGNGSGVIRQKTSPTFAQCALNAFWQHHT